MGLYIRNACGWGGNNVIRPTQYWGEKGLQQYIVDKKFTVSFSFYDCRMVGRALIVCSTNDLLTLVQLAHHGTISTKLLFGRHS